jgi:hypothetical protein
LDHHVYRRRHDPLKLAGLEPAYKLPSGPSPNAIAPKARRINAGATLLLQRPMSCS